MRHGATGYSEPMPQSWSLTACLTAHSQLKMSEAKASVERKERTAWPRGLSPALPGYSRNDVSSMSGSSSLHKRWLQHLTYTKGVRSSKINSLTTGGPGISTIGQYLVHCLDT